MNGASGFIATSDWAVAGWGNRRRCPTRGVGEAYARKDCRRDEAGSMAPSSTTIDRRNTGDLASIGLFAAEQTRHLRLERIEVGEGIVDFGRRLAVLGRRLVCWRAEVGCFLRPVGRRRLWRRPCLSQGGAGQGRRVPADAAGGSVFTVAAAGSAFEPATAGSAFSGRRGGAGAPGDGAGGLPGPRTGAVSVTRTGAPRFGEALAGMIGGGIAARCCAGRGSA
jgi:hypothetical protein